MTTRRDDTGQDLIVLTRLLDGLTGDMPAGRQERLQDHLLTEIRQSQRGQSQTGQSLPAPPPRRSRILLGAAAVLTAMAIAGTVIGITVQGGGAALPPASPLSGSGTASTCTWRPGSCTGGSSGRSGRNGSARRRRPLT